MCGRFTVTADGETICREFGLAEVPFDYRPRYNVAPMQDVLTVLQHSDGPRAGWMRWGLVPSWAEDPTIGARMINARSETIDEKSAFREAFERRRCIIIADGFYEWRRVGNVKIPMRIRMKDERPFAFAGLWEKWSRHGAEPLITCTILTTTPSASIAHIHDRMPVMLSRAARAQWLDRSADVAELKSLLVPVAAADIDAYPVATLVNFVENDTPECIQLAEPANPTEQTSLF